MPSLQSCDAFISAMFVLLTLKIFSGYCFHAFSLSVVVFFYFLASVCFSEIEI